MSKATHTRTSEDFRTALERMKRQEEARPAVHPTEQPVNFTPSHEGEHFMVCPGCGQPIDCRDPAAVLHHEEPGHRPLSLKEATRMVSSRALHAALATGRWTPGSKVTS